MAENYYRKEQIIEIFGLHESFIDELEREDLIECAYLERCQEKVYYVDQI
jgi:hypothetical protein